MSGVIRILQKIKNNSTEKHLLIPPGYVFAFTTETIPNSPLKQQKVQFRVKKLFTTAQYRFTQQNRENNLIVTDFKE